MSFTSNINVTHLAEKERFEIVIEDHTAVLNYSLHGETMVFTHTGVPNALEGRGLGSHLVKAGLDYARQQNYQVVPLCWFVAKYIQKHPEYQDLLQE